MQVLLNVILTQNFYEQVLQVKKGSHFSFGMHVIKHALKSGNNFERSFRVKCQRNIPVSIYLPRKNFPTKRKHLERSKGWVGSKQNDKNQGNGKL